METNSINSFLVLITGDIDNFMYTYILVALLVFTGIYFTIRTKGVQFRYIKDMFTQLFEKKVDKNGKAISSFQAMMVSTGSRVGTGNIAGIATALAMGGPGALFWMWVMALGVEVAPELTALAAFAFSAVMSFLGISNERFEGALARSLPPLRRTII